MHDGAGLLSGAERTALEEKLLALDRGGLEIGVALFRSLEGEPLEEVTLAIAERWAPGSAEKDDGALVAVFIEDRKVRLEIGYGLEEKIPDALAGRIIRNALAPEFREGRHAAGLTATVDAIALAADGKELPYTDERQEGEIDWVQLIFILAVVGFILYSRMRHSPIWIAGTGWGHGMGQGTRRRHRGGGFRGGFGGGLGGGSFGGGSFGGGGSSGSW